MIEMREATFGGRFTFPGTSLTVERIGYGAMQLAGPGVGDLCVSRCALASQNRPIDQVEVLLMLQPALLLSKPGLDSTLLPPEMPRNASSR